jgi:cell division protein FtsQ
VSARKLLRALLLGRARRHWRLWVALGTLGALVLAAALERAPLAVWVRSHPYFAVTEILVTPTTRVHPGALLEWVGLASGISIWSIDPAALAARLEAYPWVRRASVRRELPRRLVLRVTEREPAAILLLDKLYYVDRTGTVFACLGAHDRLDVPFVTGIEAAVLGGERPYPRRAVRQALKLLALIRAAGLPFHVSEVHIERGQGITVFPVAPPVALGFGWGRYPAKLARLGQVLGAFAGREAQIREIDLSYETQAVIRLRLPEGGRQRTRA